MSTDQIVTTAVGLARSKGPDALRAFYGQHRGRYSEAEWNAIKFRVAANLTGGRV